MPHFSVNIFHLRVWFYFSVDKNISFDDTKCEMAIMEQVSMLRVHFACFLFTQFHRREKSNV